MKVFTLRIDEGMYNELEKWADQDMRSVNSLMLVILRRALDARRAVSASGEGAEKNQEPQLVAA